MRTETAAVSRAQRWRLAHTPNGARWVGLLRPPHFLLCIPGWSEKSFPLRPIATPFVSGTRHEIGFREACVVRRAMKPIDDEWSGLRRIFPARLGLTPGCPLSKRARNALSSRSKRAPLQVTARTGYREGRRRDSAAQRQFSVGRCSRARFETRGVHCRLAAVRRGRHRDRFWAGGCRGVEGCDG
jgi:hypothetical protein